LTVSSAVTGSGGLTKFGASRLILSGANTFTGALNVAGGTVSLGSATAFPTATSTSVYGGTLDVGTAAFSAGALTFVPSGSQVAIAATAGAANQNTLTFASTAGLALGQAITGSGVPYGTYITGLTGTVATLSNNLTGAFTGNYTAQNSIGGTGIITPTSIAAFVPFAQTGYLTGTIAGTGALTKSGQGNLVLSGNTTFAPNTTSTFSGGVTLTEGVLTLGANTVVDANNAVLSGPLGTGTLTIDPVSINTWLSATPSVTQYYGGQATPYRTVANPIVVKGDFQFGWDDVDLMLTGPVALEAAAPWRSGARSPVPPPSPGSALVPSTSTATSAAGPAV
jgi:autotransporter-associated beta strand protein